MNFSPKNGKFIFPVFQSVNEDLGHFPSDILCLPSLNLFQCTESLHYYSNNTLTGEPVKS